MASYVYSLNSFVFDLLRFLALVLLKVLLMGLPNHVGGVACAHIEPQVGHATLLLVATVDHSMGLEFRHQVVLLAELADLDVSLCVVAEEHFLVLCVSINPGL